MTHWIFITVAITKTFESGKIRNPTPRKMGKSTNKDYAKGYQNEY